MPINEIENLKGAYDAPDDRDYIAEHLLGVETIELPKYVNLNVSSSHDQGRKWSCTAYALSHCVEIQNSLEFKPDKALVDPNEQWANQKLERGAARAEKMDTEGDSLQNALNTYIKYGLYNKNSVLPVEKFEATGYAKIAKTVDEFKKYLAKGYPIYTGSGYHCYPIVGYDDESEEFIAKNSYGDYWGSKKNGTFTLNYSEISGLFTPYIFFDKKDLKMIFKDVSENSPMASSIKFCLDNKIMNGYGTSENAVERLFMPNQAITRAEMSAVIERLYNLLKK